MPYSVEHWIQTDRLIETPGTNYSSPSRKAKKQVNYAESDDDDDQPFKPLSGNGRAAKRRRISVKDESDDDDEFGLDAATQAAMEEDDGMLRSDTLSLPKFSDLAVQRWTTLSWMMT